MPGGQGGSSAPRGTAAVVRFSSLGDVLLAGHMPCFLREAAPGRRVVFVTKERYEPALRGHPEVDRLYLLRDNPSTSPAPSGAVVERSLRGLVDALRREGVEELYDLHRNPRSTRLALGLPRARRVSAPKYGLRRRLIVHARWLAREPVPPILRTYREMAGLPADAPLKPWLREALAQDPPEAGGGARPYVLFGVGARWETKRWPLRHFVSLGGAVERELGMDVRYAVGPGDDPLAGELERLLPAGRGDAVCSLGFRDLARVASRAQAIVSNDSAVLHLGAALGVPTLGLFGSTVPEFGFAAQRPEDVVAEISLSCRPCDVHGKDQCPLGHHACMTELAPKHVLELFEALLESVGR
jgi:heptosyltransferase II